MRDSATPDLTSASTWRQDHPGKQPEQEEGTHKSVRPWPKDWQERRGDSCKQGADQAGGQTEAEPAGIRPCVEDKRRPPGCEHAGKQGVDRQRAVASERPAVSARAVPGDVVGEDRDSRSRQQSRNNRHPQQPNPLHGKVPRAFRHLVIMPSGSALCRPAFDEGGRGAPWKSSGVVAVPTEKTAAGSQWPRRLRCLSQSSR